VKKAHAKVFLQHQNDPQPQPWLYGQSDQYIVSERSFGAAFVLGEGSALRWPLFFWGERVQAHTATRGPVGGSAHVLPRLWLQGGTCIGQRREYNYEKRVWDAVSGRTDSLPRLWVKPQKTGNMLP